jgi:hypothetical protein
MGLLDNLRTTLQGRITSDKQLDFYASDLGTNAALFTSLAGVDTIHLTDATINDSGSPLIVTGKASVWQLPATTQMEINITESDNTLQFTLQNTASLTGWKFSDSFSSLGDSYFDNLDLSNIYLLATSYEHAVTTPAVTLVQGLNFSATTTPSSALASISALNSEIQTINLFGLISNPGSQTSVSLAATLDKPVNLSLTTSTLQLRTSENDGTQNESAQITGDYAGGDFSYPVAVTVPTQLDALDALERTLRDRMQNGSLTFYDTDLGETVAPLFFSSVFTHQLNLTSATITSSSGNLVVQGQTAVYNLSDVQISITVTEIVKDRLDFTLTLSSLPDTWKVSDSFPQTAGDLFDGLAINSKALTATSYVHTVTGQTSALAPGLNFSLQVSLQSGSLQPVSALQSNVSSLDFSGIVTQNNTNYNIDLQNSTLAASLQISPVGLSPMQLSNPVVHLISKPETSGEITNTSQILGSLKLNDQLTFAAVLTLPAGDEADWDLTFDQGTTVNVPDVEDLITEAAGSTALALFPDSLQILSNLKVADFDVQFDQDINSSTYYFTSVTLNPGQDGTPRSWQILTSPNLAVSNFRFGIGTSYVQSDLDPKPYIITGQISGDINIGTTTNLAVTLSIPLSGDWLLNVSSDNARLPTLSDLASFIWPQGGHSEQDLLAPLPEGLENSNLAIILKQIEVGFNPFTPSLSLVSFDLSQDGIWEILPVFQVSEWTVSMTVDVADNYNITGLLHGYMQIGDVAHMEATLPIPAGETGWTINLKEGTTVDFPGIGELLKLIGGSSVANGLPESFNTFGSFSLEVLSVNFNPSPAVINSFEFQMTGKEDWVVLQDFLSFSDISAQLKVQKSNEVYQSTGDFNGFVNIFGYDIWLQAVKENVTDPWIFRLAVEQEIHIPGLAELASWMLPDTMVSYIPETFMPFGEGFDLTVLNIDFDLTSEQLNSIDFSIVNSAPWNAIPGYVTLDNTVLASQVTVNDTDSADSTLAVHIGTDLTIGDTATISFTADYVSAVPHWSFTAKLADQVTFNFADLLTAIHLDTVFSIPADLGLPTLTIQSLNGSMVPETGKFYIDGSVIVLPSQPPAEGTQADWSVPFLGLQFKMFGLTAKVDFKNLSPEDPQNKNYFKANLGAFLDMNTLQLYVGLQLGSSGTDNIFTGTLTVSQLQTLQINQFGDGLVAGQNGATNDNQFPDNNQWSKLTPNDMTLVQYAGAFVYFNQTQNKFFLYGGISNFGDAIFLSQNTGQANDQRGYIFSFALADNFKFSDLFAGLAPIDSILQISNAGITVTSYTVASATALVQQIDQIISVSDKPGAITNPIKQGNLPAGPVNQGVHLYGRLLLTGPLFSVFTQLDAADTTGLDVTLYAFFSTDAEPAKGSVKTIFQATFAPFSLIQNLVTFTGASGAPGVMMQYTQADASEFKLSGTIGFNVFGGSYQFVGDLLVNDDQTRFTVTTTPDTSVTIQLFPASMPPIFVLKQLGLDVIYYFQTQQRTEKYLELNVTGKVELVNTIFLTSNLYLLGGTPVLALTTLTQDFKISQLIGNLVGNNQVWDTTVFDITFKADTPQQHARIYYYDASADPESKVNTSGNNFRNGYNLDATIDLTFLFTVTILMKINVETNVGMEASVGLTEPINIFILELASKQKATTGNKKYINSPTLTLNTKHGPTQFGFSTGFNFFEYPFGTADVTVGNKDLGGGKSETKIQAHLVADEAVPIFGDLSVDFSYCRSEGFVVNDWPDFTQIYEDVQNIINIADEVTDLMRSADPTLVCGAITNLIAEAAYENKFNMSATFDTEPGGIDGYSLFFVLNGQFKVLVAGQEVTSIPFPNTLRIPLPDGTSFDNMGAYIADAIKASATSFVQSLVNNGEQWAKLAGILFAQQAAELAAQWLCEGLIDAITAEAVAAAGAAVLTATEAGLGIAAAVGAGIAAAAGIFSSSCFTAGTEVIMADGSVKRIEEVQINDVLAGYNGIENKVLAFDHPKLGHRKLYAFNDGPFFVTAEHPFLTEQGWKAIDPAATRRENPELEVGRLVAGDVLLKLNGEKLKLNEIHEQEADSDTQLYNFRLSGNNTYYANHLIAHNKGSCFTAGTLVLMADGSAKAIENILIGDLLAGQDGSVNEVTAFDHPLLGSRKLYSINGSEFFVTAEHPFFTKEGWKAIDPAATAKENPELKVGILKPGDHLVLANGETEEISAIDSRDAAPDTQLYNFILKGNHSYFANNYLVHNKGGGGGDPDPDKPAITSSGLNYLNGKLKVSWYGAAYASGYELEFYDPQGHKIGSTQSLGLSTTTGDTTISLNFNGGSYAAKVRSVRGSKRSDWATATIQKIADPTQVIMGYTSATDQLSVSWTESGTAQFSVNLYPVAQPTQIQNHLTGQSPYTQKGADLSPAGAWEAQVTAVAPNGTSAVPSQAVTTRNRYTKLNPVQSPVISANGSKLVVGWQDAQTGVDHYLIEVAVDGQSVFNTTVNAGTTTTSLESAAYPAGTVTVKITPAGSAGYINGNAVSASGVTKLAQPGSPALALDKPLNKITATWTTVTNAKLYSVVLKDETNAIAYQKTDVAADVQSLDILVSELTGNGTVFTLQVTATGDTQYLNSSLATSAGTVTRLAPTASIQVAIQQNNLVTAWTAVTNAVQYIVKVLDTNNANTPVASKTIAAPQQGQQPGYTFTPQDFTTPLNGVYTVSVKAIGAATVIDSATTVSSALPVPAVVFPALSLTFADNYINADWQKNDTRVTQYTLQLFNAAGAPVGGPVITDKNTAQFLLTQPADNTVYSVKIKVKIDQYESDWSPATAITVYIVAAPAQLQAGTDGTSVIAAWKAVNAINSYSVSINNTDGTQLIPPVTVNATQALITNSLILRGSVYNVSVRSQKGQSFSPAVTVTGLTVAQPATETFYLPQAFNDSGEPMYLGNGQTLNWGSSYANMQAVTVQNIQSDSVVAMVGGGNPPIPWFSFAFGLQNLQNNNGYNSGDLVTFRGFDSGANQLLVQSAEGANGPYSWSLSAVPAVNNLNQVFRIFKWISNDGGGNAQFGSGPIQAGDYIMLLALGHNSVNTSMDSGPEAIVWKFELKPAGRNLVLLPVQNNILAFNAPASLNSNWQKSQLATSYKAELWNLNGGTSPLISKEITSPSELTPAPHTTFDITPYLQNNAGLNYQVKIIAENANGYNSSQAGSNQIQQFAQTTLQTAVYAAPLVTGTWTVVSGATGYTMRVSQNGTTISTGKTSKLTDSLNVAALAAGTYDFSVQATGAGGTVPGVWSNSIQFVIPQLSPNAFAKQKHDAGFTNLQTATALHQQFPTISANDFAVAMAYAGYTQQETTLALKQEFPALTPQQFSQAMLAAYPATTPEAFAKQYYKSGVPVLTTATDLVRNFPQVTPTDFAIALAKAGYNQTDVTQALKQQFPSLTPQQFAQVMLSAFPATTPTELATGLKQSSTSPEDAASKLVKNFPSLNATTLAQAMASGGYSKTDVTLGLKKVWPTLAPADFAKAMKAAFP